MGARRFVPSTAGILPLAMALFAPMPVTSQDQPPPSALINQESEETVEAARAASPNH